MAKKIDIDWIKEADAAALLSVKPSTLRRYAKTGHWQINFTKPNHYTFEYNRYDIDAHKLSRSTITR